MGRNSFLLLVIVCLAQTLPAWSQGDSVPALAWQYRLKAPVFSAPAGDDKAVYFGSLDSCFYALELNSGALLWKYKTKGGIRSAPLLQQERLYFISDDGFVYCLSAKGKLQWKFDAASVKKYDFADYHQSSLVIDQGVLFFGSGDGHVYGLHAADGRLKWKFKTGDAVHATPAFDENAVYAGSFDGFFYALDKASGSLLWKFKTLGHRYFPKGEVQGSPVLSDKLVFFGARDYNVYALDKKAGYCHWNKAFPKGWVLSLQCADSVLYMAGADERILMAADPVSGKESWCREMEFLMFGKVVKEGASLFIGTTIGKVHAVSAVDGKGVWTFCTQGYTENRFKYFKEDDRYRDDIYSIIRSDEHFLDVECELGGIFSTVLSTGHYMVFSSTEGAVYCLRKPGMKK
ncbi:MAG: PQQ-binding-like beta-propeller repeat protein [Bacteroidia bacterium]|nr:PQQ-binding-like beta-propeller repeat protein [Bacteroidia bacterium]